MGVHGGIDQERVRNAIQTFYIANKYGILTDAAILGLTTVAGLRLLFTNASVHASDELIKRSGEEKVDEMQKLGLLTNTNVAAADTFAGLQALLTGSDPATDDTPKYLGDINYSGNNRAMDV